MGKNPADQFYWMDFVRDMEEHPHDIAGAWLFILYKLWYSPEQGKATKTVQQWSRVLRVSEEKTVHILTYIRDNGIGDVTGLSSYVTACPTNVTVINRRMYRGYKERTNNRLRKQRQRSHAECHANVTAPSSKDSKDSTSKKEKTPVFCEPVTDNPERIEISQRIIDAIERGWGSRSVWNMLMPNELQYIRDLLGRYDEETFIQRWQWFIGTDFWRKTNWALVSFHRHINTITNPGAPEPAKPYTSGVPASHPLTPEQKLELDRATAARELGEIIAAGCFSTEDRQRIRAEFKQQPDYAAMYEFVREVRQRKIHLAHQAGS